MKLKINNYELTGEPDELITFLICCEMKETIKKQITENLVLGDEEDGSV